MQPDNKIKPQQLSHLRKLVDDILEASSKEMARDHLVEFAFQATSVRDILSPKAQEKLRKVLVSSQQIVTNPSYSKTYVNKTWASFESIV